MSKPKSELARMLARLSRMAPQEAAAVIELLEPEVRKHAQELLAGRPFGARATSDAGVLQEQGLSSWMIERIEGRYSLADATRTALREIARSLRDGTRTGRSHEDLKR